MTHQTIENPIPNLQSTDLMLQYLFMFSRKFVPEQAYLQFISAHSEALMSDIDFFKKAQQGLLLTAKTKRFTTAEQSQVLKQKEEDFGVLDQADFDAMEKYLATAFMLWQEDTNPEFLSQPPEEDQPETNYEEDLEKLALNERDAKEAVFHYRVAVNTLGYLYQRRRPSYRSLNPTAPIAQDQTLYRAKADWMLNNSPQHTYFRLKKLGKSHQQAKRAIASGEPLSHEKIAELFRLGHFLAALHMLTAIKVKK